MNEAARIEQTELELSSGEQQLIRMVLNQDLTAWRDWAETYDIDEHTKIEFQLFPAVYKTLAQLNEPHPWKGRLKGVYRQHWAKGQRSRATFSAAVAVLQNCAVDFLQPFEYQVGELLGDTALIAAPRARIAIRSADSARAIAGFSKAGWHVLPAPYSLGSRMARLQSTEWTLTNSAGDTLWLSNFYHNSRRDPLTSHLVWERASRHTNIPHMFCVDSAHLLYEALSDQPANTNSIRWLISAAAVLSASSDIVATASIQSRFYHALEKRAELLAKISDGRFQQSSMSSLFKPDNDEKTARHTPQHNLYTRLCNLRRQVNRWGGIRGTLVYLYQTKSN